MWKAFKDFNRDATGYTITAMVAIVVGLILWFGGVSAGVIQGDCFPYDQALEFGEQDSRPTIVIDYRFEDYLSEPGRVVYAPTAIGTHKWQTLDVPLNASHECESAYWQALRDIEAVLNRQDRELGKVPTDMSNWLVGIRELQGAE